MNELENILAVNSPQAFWRIHPSIDERIWNEAIQKSKSILGLLSSQDGQYLAMTLGEGRFGDNRWRLSFPKRVYYQLKPFLPRNLTKLLRKLYLNSDPKIQPHWPIDDRYVNFQYEIIKNIITSTGKSHLRFFHFWPNNAQFALILTHDIETSQGQRYVRRVAELEMDLGFRSSFNFVSDRYPLEDDVIQYLRKNGFEVGSHGCKHDGKLFNSARIFSNRAEKINQFISKYGVAGFRAPLTNRQPIWMQQLNIEYDLSFFDTDPFEPMPGGTMSIWPFKIGKFIELPYTLVQDYTLVSIIGERTPKIWLDKVDYLERNSGMVLVNTHPDYLQDPITWEIYEQFLLALRKRGNYWNALPKDAAHWWNKRLSLENPSLLPGGSFADLHYNGESVLLSLAGS